MFGRRVYASASVPRRMWPALHIQSSAQSNRILPSLAALRPAIARHDALESALLTGVSEVGRCGTPSALYVDILGWRGSDILSVIDIHWFQPHKIIPPFMAEYNAH
uniref:Uncharacterized protein n=1 Tax=Trypanosoma congolense (strain IL3000) TaxID=1068625 RepID=G0UYW9_TRYCI|nr:conserved hypothetical protein [Trypanosoma congolense IL3000]